MKIDDSITLCEQVAPVTDTDRRIMAECIAADAIARQMRTDALHTAPAEANELRSGISHKDRRTRFDDD